MSWFLGTLPLGSGLVISRTPHSLDFIPLTSSLLSKYISIFTLVNRNYLTSTPQLLLPEKATRLCHYDRQSFMTRIITYFTPLLILEPFYPGRCLHYCPLSLVP